MGDTDKADIREDKGEGTEASFQSENDTKRFQARHTDTNGTDIEGDDKDDSGEGKEDLTKGHRDASATKNAGKSDNSDYEDVCFICRRPESKAGKMIKLPNNICICDDCMHKTMETVSQFDYQGMLNNPGFQNELDQMARQGFPNISFVNLADLQGDGGIPNKQKLKKKKKKEEGSR